MRSRTESSVDRRVRGARIGLRVADDVEPRPRTKRECTSLHSGRVPRTREQWWYYSPMGNAMLNPPPGFDDLTVDDQIEYVQALWERIAAKENDVSVPAWHRAELDRRLADHEATPDAGRPWEEVERALRARLAGRR